MGLRFEWSVSVVALGLSALFGCSLSAQESASGGQYPENLVEGLHWRDVGPMRGGRSFGVAGVASEPDTFYFGSVGGGVWKTENAGRTWTPISDQGIPIGSIGAVAVAPSDPNVVYVGTGEPDIRAQHSYGIGMFKSVDAGKTWRSVGLEKTSQIGRIVVDPSNPNRVYVAALGHVYDGEPGARRLSLERWRRALEEGAVQRIGSERCGRDRHCCRFEKPKGAVRLAVGYATAAVAGVCALVHAGQRSV